MAKYANNKPIDRVPIPVKIQASIALIPNGNSRGGCSRTPVPTQLSRISLTSVLVRTKHNMTLI